MKLNKDITITTDNDVIVIQNLNTGDLLVTNETGGFILDNLEDNQEAILTKLKEKYAKVNPAELESDLNEFIAECQRKGVLYVD